MLWYESLREAVRALVMPQLVAQGVLDSAGQPVAPGAARADLHYGFRFIAFCHNKPYSEIAKPHKMTDELRRWDFAKDHGITSRATISLVPAAIALVDS